MFSTSATTCAAVVSCPCPCGHEPTATTTSPQISSLQFAPWEFPENGACGFTICDCPKLFVPESSVVPMPIPTHLPSARAAACFFFHSSQPILSFATCSILG